MSITGFSGFQMFEYVGEIQTIGTGQIRVVSITDPQFVPFADIIILNRIFKWYRPSDR